MEKPYVVPTREQVEAAVAKIQKVKSKKKPFKPVYPTRPTPHAIRIAALCARSVAR